MILLIIVGAIGAFFAFDLGQYLSFEFLKSKQQDFQDYYTQNELLTVGVYLIVYVAVTGLSLPGAAVMTLAGGLMFGLVTGTIVVSFASTLGATLSFLVSRFLLKDYVQSKFKSQLKSINEGIEKEGAFYLFSLRLIPLFPFFAINLIMGLMPIRTWQFFVVSQIGMLPGTIAYVNAGTSLGTIDSLSGILSVQVLISFAVLGIIPILSKKIVDTMRDYKALKGHKKPGQFDYNVLVIGAGAAGLVSSYIAATLKAKVGLIEKYKMGGDCLNTGCVPSKAIIKSAKVANLINKSKAYGLETGELKVDFEAVMGRVHNVIAKVEPHDSVERYSQLGVECIQGAARIKSPYEIEVNGETLTTRAIIVATGASPFVPPIEGLEKIKPLTSENIWNLKQLPKRLIVLGGGPIGSELAQSFARLGSHVTQVERGSRIMGREDKDVSAEIQRRFESEGIDIKTNHLAKRVVVEGERKALVCENDGSDIEIEFDEILIAVGRKANTKGFGLEELGVELSPQGTIAHNEFMATNFPNIFVCGDVAGPYQFTHTAAHQAYYAIVNALFRPFTNFVPAPFNKSLKADYSVIPWATYTDPEVATVGLTETAAKQAEIEYEVTKYGIDDLDRAIAESEDHGFVKVLTKPGTDQILGATIVGFNASDMIGEYIAAMKNGFGLGKIMGTVHIYPTMSEANKYAAGEWKKARKPEAALARLQKFFAWRRA
ncbi:MAG: FAD-dependent oxidoreductase [Bdellovibrionales bacterium]|nr:FAD-dependent oxidoreductase [Bdellovibrionales bacterium]